AQHLLACHEHDARAHQLLHDGVGRHVVLSLDPETLDEARLTVLCWVQDERPGRAEIRMWAATTTLGFLELLFRDEPGILSLLLHGCCIRKEHESLLRVHRSDLETTALVDRQDLARLELLELRQDGIRALVAPIHRIEAVTACA